MKTEFGVKNCLYPLPTVLVGTLVKGKPNYVTIAHVGIMDLEVGFAWHEQAALHQPRNKGNQNLQHQHSIDKTG